jgi:hypothetical protein
MRGRRHDSISLPGGQRDSDPDSLGTRVATAGKHDDTRINIDQEHEVKYWSEKLGVSRDQLKSAVAKVGSMVKHVRDHLQHRS